MSRYYGRRGRNLQSLHQQQRQNGQTYNNFQPKKRILVMVIFLSSLITILLPSNNNFEQYYHHLIYDSEDGPTTRPSKNISDYEFTFPWSLEEEKTIRNVEETTVVPTRITNTKTKANTTNIQRKRHDFFFLYHNLSCPLEWSKYSCWHMISNQSNLNKNNHHRNDRMYDYDGHQYGPHRQEFSNDDPFLVQAIKSQLYAMDNILSKTMLTSPSKMVMDHTDDDSKTHDYDDDKFIIDKGGWLWNIVGRVQNKNFVEVQRREKSDEKTGNDDNTATSRRSTKPSKDRRTRNRVTGNHGDHWLWNVMFGPFVPPQSSSLSSSSLSSSFNRTSSTRTTRTRRTTTTRRIFLIGDSTIRQVFIALGCRLHHHFTMNHYYHYGIGRYNKSNSKTKHEKDKGRHHQKDQHTNDLSDDGGGEQEAEQEDGVFREYYKHYMKFQIDWSSSAGGASRSAWPCHGTVNCIPSGPHSGFSFASMYLNETVLDEKQNQQERRRRRRRVQTNSIYEGSNNTSNRIIATPNILHHEIHFLPTAGAPSNVRDGDLIQRWYDNFQNFYQNDYKRKKQQERHELSLPDWSKILTLQQSNMFLNNMTKLPLHVRPNDDIIVFTSGLHGQYSMKQQNLFSKMIQSWTDFYHEYYHDVINTTISTTNVVKNNDTAISLPPPVLQFPKIIYMGTYTQHFMTSPTGEYVKPKPKEQQRKQQRQRQAQQNNHSMSTTTSTTTTTANNDSTEKTCRSSVPSNRRHDRELELLRPYLNLFDGGDGTDDDDNDDDNLRRRKIPLSSLSSPPKVWWLPVNDVKLGDLHVNAHGMDCSHYCMPGVPDVVADTLLQLLLHIK